jgi:type I restriction enzyme, S subunit
VTPEALVEKFDVFAEVPNAAAKLRQLVLEWATTGRLVEQSHADEPATALLERIDKHFAVIRAGRGTRGPAVEPLDTDSLSPLPETWRWVRLGNVVDYGVAEKAESADIPQDAWLLDLEDIEKDTSRLLTRKTFRDSPSKSTKTAFVSGDVLYGKLRPYLNKVLVADAPGYCTTEIVPIRTFGFIEPTYLCYALMRPSFVAYAQSRSYGMNLPRLGTEDARRAAFPLPPLAEQKRIVAKVKGLLASCDRLEAQQREREARHAALVRASLARFADAPTPANLGLLFHHSYDVAPGDLRKAIFTLAVRGRLVAQDANDEPAAQLLTRIADLKAELADAGKLRGVTTVTAMADDAGDYDLPASWVWVRFGAIMINRDGERIPVSKEERATRPKIYDYYGASGVIDKIDAHLFEKPLLLIGEDGANLINRSTPIAFMARGKYWVNNHAHVLDGISEDFLRYIALHINAIDLEAYVTGSAQPKMNQAKMNTIPIALPPLAEQRRIVAKVDELVALVDVLVAQLANARITGTALLEALAVDVTALGTTR